MKWAGPFAIVNPRGRGPVMIVCDHASNVLPDGLTDLGVSDADLERHIAWDIGAAAIATSLAEVFDAPAVLCGTSRLVIDCNRQLDDPSLIPLVSDGTTIPGNHRLTPARRRQRIDRYFHTYHDACREVVGTACAGGRRPLFVSVHSMTERLNGEFRPWEIALSSDDNRRATAPALAALGKAPGLAVGDNQPYGLDPAQDYSTPEHAFSRGLDYLQVEFRQDLVATEAGQQRFAQLFASAVRAALAACSESV